MADNVVLENGGRLDVLEGHSAQKTRVDDGGTLPYLPVVRQQMSP